ncbi:hypothetical protein LTR66_000927 [Elasticomyces elasticus]|nr:hypothetical protein LTR66_000927 [Elasticomyces elasticus]
MSIVSISSGTPTVTAEDLHTLASKVGFTIEPRSEDEKAFLLFANSLDATAKEVENLPEYVDPRLLPTPVEGGERKYIRPAPKDNPLNAWSHKSELKASSSGKLSGKTVAFKDNISVGSLPLTIGTSPTFFVDDKYPISTIDASVVSRVLTAGGHGKGTAVCENFSVFALSYSAHTGPVHNAWGKGYATGGSSSGCAALISAKDVKVWKEMGKELPLPTDALDEEGVDMGIGGDQGGSIRLPAAYSGIYGLKPTHGLIPYTGIANLLPSIDHTGPMARSLEDIATLLTVLAGYDGIDPRQTPETPLRSNVLDYNALLASWIDSRRKVDEWTPSSSAKGLRIGILKEGWQVPGLDSEVSSLVRNAADRFRSLGAEVHEVSVPLHLQGAAIWSIACRPGMPATQQNRAGDMLSHTLPGFEPRGPDQHLFDTLAHRNPAVPNILLNAVHLEKKYGPGLTRRAQMQIYALRAAYDEALEKCDVMLTPVNPTVGMPHPKGLEEGGKGAPALELVQNAVGSTCNTCPFNVTGHPAMSVPVGWGRTRDGKGKLPVGMQFVGKRWGELDVLKAASAWEVGGRGLWD